jgi:hypothetical protein
MYKSIYRRGVSITRGKYQCFSDHAYGDVEQVDSFAFMEGLKQGYVVFLATWVFRWYEETY